MTRGTPPQPFSEPPPAWEVDLAWKNALLDGEAALVALSENRARYRCVLESRGAGAAAWDDAAAAEREFNAADAALREVERVAGYLRWLRAAAALPAFGSMAVDTATREEAVTPALDANREASPEAGVIDLNFWGRERAGTVSSEAAAARVPVADPVADPVAAAIIGFAENAADWEPLRSAETGTVDPSRRVWKGPATTLLGEFAELVADDIRRERGWPRDATRLRECLRRAAGELRIRGIRVDLFTEHEELPDGRKGVLRPTVTIAVPAPEMTGR